MACPSCLPKLPGLIVLVGVAAGCGNVPQPAEHPSPSSQSTKKSPAKPPPREVAQRSPLEKRNPPGQRPPVSEADSSLASGPERQAVKKLGTVIRQSVELDRTLVIWLLDRSPSARELVHEVSQAVVDLYRSAEMQALSSAPSQPLLTVVAGFDQQVQFLLDPPASDANRLQEALQTLTTGESGQELPLTALKQTLEKYLPHRTQEQRQIVVILVTDEAGHDPQLGDELIEITRRQAIPVYVIGRPAPWGQANPFAPDPKAVESTSDDMQPMWGPESVQSERVDIENWTARHATRISTDLVDSGFGPFALERLCRASRGQFLALRPEFGFGYRGAGAAIWPTGDELRFEPQVVNRYTPDYVSSAEYQQLLANNKARAALVAAAKLPKVSIEGMPGSRFPKAAEAKMANQLSAAQKFAASNSPRVDRLYEVLAAGEGERSQLTGLRWQAQFDLAFGRAAANKARLDGYNSMLAALKRGKSFTAASSTEWVLEPADHFETESTIKRLADKAKEHLGRVIQDHPGTPWAKIAEEELRLPLGWGWGER